MAVVEDLGRLLSDELQPLGFEIHPFLVGWYNRRVAEKFRMPHSEDTLAFVVISRPSMFERAFVPFLARREKAEQTDFRGDPIDECMRECLQRAVQVLPGDAGRVTVTHDFELWPNRRPKVLVQTAAHVSGAVTFFRADDVTDEKLLSLVQSSKVYPVCLHKRLGGWFAIRGVIVLDDIRAPDLTLKEQPLTLPQETIAKLLLLYNDHWQDWRFRDVIPSEETYSDLQREYFSTLPGERDLVVKKILSKSH